MAGTLEVLMALEETSVLQSPYPDPIGRAGASRSTHLAFLQQEPGSPNMPPTIVEYMTLEILAGQQFVGLSSLHHAGSSLK